MYVDTDLLGITLELIVEVWKLLIAEHLSCRHPGEGEPFGVSRRADDGCITLDPSIQTDAQGCSVDLLDELACQPAAVVRHSHCIDGLPINTDLGIVWIVIVISTNAK